MGWEVWRERMGSWRGIAWGGLKREGRPYAEREVTRWLEVCQAAGLRACGDIETVIVQIEAEVEMRVQRDRTGDSVLPASMSLFGARSRRVWGPSSSSRCGACDGAAAPILHRSRMEGEMWQLFGDVHAIYPIHRRYISSRGTLGRRGGFRYYLPALKISPHSAAAYVTKLAIQKLSQTHEATRPFCISSTATRQHAIHPLRLMPAPYTPTDTSLCVSSLPQLLHYPLRYCTSRVGAQAAS